MFLLTGFWCWRTFLGVEAMLKGSLGHSVHAAKVKVTRLLRIVSLLFVISTLRAVVNLMLSIQEMQEDSLDGGLASFFFKYAFTWVLLIFFAEPFAGALTVYGLNANPWKKRRETGSFYTDSGITFSAVDKAKLSLEESF